MESFGVTTLYANASNDAALQAQNFSCNIGALQIFMFSISKVVTLFKICLICNIVRWRTAQSVHGLAMRQRLAPALTIALMVGMEQLPLERHPFLYCRYINIVALFVHPIM